MCLAMPGPSVCVCSFLIASVFFFLYLKEIEGYYIPISDTVSVYPLLFNADSAKPLRWGTGTIAQTQLRSSVVRVSDRGVRFVLRPSTLISGSKENRSAVCHVGQGALCSTEGGNVVFPESPSRAIVPSSGYDVAEPVLQAVALSECKQHSNRAVIFGIALYTVTLCDITQKGFEIIHVLDDFTLRVWHRDDSWVVYVVVSVLAVLLMTCIAQDITHMFGNRNERPNPLLATVCCIALVVLVWIIPTHYVVWSDLVYQWVLTAYISISVLQWVLRLALCFLSSDSKDYGVPFNVVIATLMLTLCRMYSGIECQYILPLLFMLAVRAFHKAAAIFYLSVVSTWSPEDFLSEPLDEEAVLLWRMDKENIVLSTLYCIVTGLDFAVLGLSHQYGFRPLFQRAYAGDVYFVAMLLAAQCVVLLVCESSVSQLDRRQSKITATRRPP